MNFKLLRLTCSSTLRRAAVAVALVASAMAGPANADPFPARVATTGGSVEGSVTDSVLSWKSIPFAAPPVGDLRWRPPQPVKPWKGVLKAKDFPPDCMQKVDLKNSNIGIPPIRTTPSEDCLYLNVMRPADTGSGRLPVMVWIFGGGFSVGGTSPTMFQGEELAKQGVVFVSINYRLGRFGFFGHPALTREFPNEPKANYGFMDQMAALKWVRANIAAFGGDPNNVTVFGESAGAGSIEAIMTSPMGKGLFDKAIIQSGGVQSLSKRELRNDQPGRLSLEKFGTAFATSKGISGEGKDAAARLRSLPASELIELSQGLPASKDQARTTWGGPSMDGKVLPIVKGDLYWNGRFAPVPTIIGSNSDDITASLGATEDHPLDYSLARFGSQKEAALQAYDPDGTRDPRLIRRRIVADDHMIEIARFVARAIAGKGAPVYRYHFAYVPEALQQRWIFGAPHGSEISFVFNNMQRVYGPTLAPRDAEVGKALSAYWVNFARTGNPNGPNLPVWPRFVTKDDVILKVHPNGVLGAGPDALKDRLDLAETVAQPERTGTAPADGVPTWPRYEPKN